MSGRRRHYQGDNPSRIAEFLAKRPVKKEKKFILRSARDQALGYLMGKAANSL
jgi:hypothetical protein